MLFMQNRCTEQNINDIKFKSYANTNRTRCEMNLQMLAVCFFVVYMCKKQREDEKMEQQQSSALYTLIYLEL